MVKKLLGLLRKRIAKDKLNRTEKVIKRKVEKLYVK